MQLANDFTKGNPVRQSLRHSFGQSLLELARQDERIVALPRDGASLYRGGGSRTKLSDSG